jgi:hypothetical protein
VARWIHGIVQLQARETEGELTASFGLQSCQNGLISSHSEWWTNSWVLEMGSSELVRAEASLPASSYRQSYQAASLGVWQVWEMEVTEEVNQTCLRLDEP